MGAYRHETFECARVRATARSEAPKSVVVPYVVKAEGSELSETEGSGKVGAFERERMYQHAAH